MLTLIIDSHRAFQLNRCTETVEEIQYRIHLEKEVNFHPH